jgi:hypothetical protein
MLTAKSAVNTMATIWTTATTVMVTKVYLA